MGTLASTIWAELFLKIEKAPEDQIFWYVCMLLTNTIPEKKQQESYFRDKETAHILFVKFSIFAKMTRSFWPGQSPLALPILIC